MKTDKRLPKNRKYSQNMLAGEDSLMYLMKENLTGLKNTEN